MYKLCQRERHARAVSTIKHINNLTKLMNFNTTYNKEDLMAHLSQLCPEGYTLNSNYQCVKEDTEKRIAITFHIIERFPFEACIKSVSVNYSFFAVEQLFHNVAQNIADLGFGHGVDFYTFRKSFGRNFIGEEVFLFLIDNPIEDDASFNTVYPYLQQMLNAALSFKDSYDSLQDLYNLGETMVLEKQAWFYTNPLPARKMIVKKLLGISDYSAYATDIVNFYSNEPHEATFYNFVQQLKNTLDAL